MDMISLRSGLGVSDHPSGVIDELIEQKTFALEQGMAVRVLELDNFMARILNQPVGQVCGVARPDLRARVDAMFAATVLDSFNAAPYPVSAII